MSFEPRSILPTLCHETESDVWKKERWLQNKCSQHLTIRAKGFWPRWGDQSVWIAMNSMGNQGTTMQGEYKSETMPDPQKAERLAGSWLEAWGWQSWVRRCWLQNLNGEIPSGWRLNVSRIAHDRLSFEDQFFFGDIELPWTIWLSVTIHMGSYGRVPSSWDL